MKGCRAHPIAPKGHASLIKSGCGSLFQTYGTVGVSPKNPFLPIAPGRKPLPACARRPLTAPTAQSPVKPLDPRQDALDLLCDSPVTCPVVHPGTVRISPRGRAGCGLPNHHCTIAEACHGQSCGRASRSGEMGAQALMRVIRQYTRLVGVLCWTSFCFCLRVMARIVKLVSPPTERRLRKAIFQTCMKGNCRISGMRVEVRGTPPDPPFFMVSNHLSVMDTVVLAGELGCVFVARGDLEKWPLFGLITRQLETIYIDRQRMRDTVRVNELIGRALQGGYGVHVFAESTVSEDATVHPFKAALLESPASMGLPVHYLSLHYATPEGHPPASDIVVWKDNMSFLRNFLNIAALPHSNAIVTFGDSPIANPDRKVLAEQLCDAVREQFIPLK